MKPENNQTPPTLHTHEDAVLWFISRLDWEMVSELLDEDRTYQNFPKWEFINKLRNAFEQFTAQGDTCLLVFPGRCDSCNCDNYKKSGYILYGNHTKNYIQLIVELDDNERISDLYECNSFKVSISTKFMPGKRIEIDELLPPF